jgi:DNA mismatch repair ATPase MutL
LVLLESIITVKLQDLFNNSLDANATKIKVSLSYNEDKKEFNFFIKDN